MFPVRLLLAGLLAGALALPATARAADPAAATLGLPAGASGQASAGQEALRERLGEQGLVAVDAQTRTPRVVAKLDGFLTAPTDASAADVALGYVEGRPEVFRLDGGDMNALRLVREDTTPQGTTHLLWRQTYKGIPAIDSHLQASVSRGGRLIAVAGAPRADLAVPSIDPEVGEAAAIAAVVRSVGAERTGDERAELVIYEAASGARLGWRVLARPYLAVVDARTGDVVRRSNRIDHASALVLDRYPGAPHGGTAQLRDITGYLDPGATRLRGPYAHVFIDPQDDDTAAPADEIAPRTPGGDWDYALSPFTYGTGGCGTTKVCTWQHTDAGSWPTNAAQDATQLFWFVNRFRDRLAAAPVGFDGFGGSDRVIAQAADGVSTGKRNNANMWTPPEGSSPQMQMYLFTWNGQGTSSAQDAGVVYHEYTHGLSNRLITDASGWGALDSAQAGAMGEAWSDWYALDFLVDDGQIDDTAAPGDVVIGDYVGSLRNEGIDCPVGPASAGCPDGGYTYGDFGEVYGYPEVHGDGEIWGQTLWDLRERIGSSAARRLVTDAMRLSPPEPTFLDQRNAILQADTVAGGTHRADIWAAFAERGMGYYASTVDGADVRPIEDFSLPPTSGGPTSTVRGLVRDAATGAPLAGARVAFGGHDTGLGEDFSATTGADGRYAIAGVSAGTYPQLIVSRSGGYLTAVRRDVAVAGGEATQDFTLRRSLADAVTSVTGPNYAGYGCPASALIDRSPATGWGSDVGTQEIVVRLKSTTTVGGMAIDPSSVCGDPASASLAGYELHVSADGTSWRNVAAGTFTAADVGRLNDVALSGDLGGVRYVKLVALSNQGHSDYMDVAELAIYAPDASAPPAPNPEPTSPPAAAPADPAPAAEAAALAAPAAAREAAPVEPESPVALPAGAFAVTRGIARFRIAFADDLPAGTGTAKLLDVRSGAAASTLLGRATFRGAPGARAEVRITLTRSGRRALRRRGRLRAALVVRVPGSASVRRTVTIKPRADRARRAR